MFPADRLTPAAGEFRRYLDETTVVSSFTDITGKEVAISRYGDDNWELWPYFEQSNVTPSDKRIQWGTFPAGMRAEFKIVVYRYWTEGSPGLNRPIARTVVQLIVHLRAFSKYLMSIGVAALGDVRPIDLANFIHHRRTVDKVKPGTLVRNLLVIEALYRFRSEHGLMFQPWPRSSAAVESGYTYQGRVSGATPLIPEKTLRVLFVAAERLLADADRLLDERDRGGRRTGFDPEVNLLRDACFFLMGVLTGMRCEEIVGIQVGAGRSESRQGVTFHWVQSIEHKTKKGRVEYLMPAVCLRVLAVMERWSKPLRDELRTQVALHATEPGGASRRTEALADVNRLFLGRGGREWRIRSISGITCRDRMQKFAENAGEDWKLRPHQLRRTYAWTFARHRLGNLLFLKEQFKHASISMTQLYAASPLQDDALYEDLFDEIATQKIELVEGWLNSDQPLAGRAGERIVKMRAHDFPDRKAMIRDTAEMVSIRSTGHSWCLAQDEGCGGAGLYEPTRCAGCSDAVIDLAQRDVWQEIHSHQTGLLDEAAALGPATMQRVRRDLQRAEEVMVKLGWKQTPRDA